MVWYTQQFCGTGSTHVLTQSSIRRTAALVHTYIRTHINSSKCMIRNCTYNIECFIIPCIFYHFQLGMKIYFSRGERGKHIVCLVWYMARTAIPRVINFIFFNLSAVSIYFPFFFFFFFLLRPSSARRSAAPDIFLCLSHFSCVRYFVR